MRKSLITAVLVVLSTGAILRAQQEKKDESPPKEAAKSKAPANEKLTMTVITKTGKVNKNAKADKIKVYVLINGDPAHKVQLDNLKKNDRELGATDTYKNLAVDVPLEEIKTMVLAVEGDDMWKCEFISFQFFQKGLQSREYKFNPARFLSGAREAKKLNATPQLEFKLSTKPVLAPPEPPEKTEKPAEKPEPKGSEKKK